MKTATAGQTDHEMHGSSGVAAAQKGSGPALCCSTIHFENHRCLNSHPNLLPKPDLRVSQGMVGHPDGDQMLKFAESLHNLGFGVNPQAG